MRILEAIRARLGPLIFLLAFVGLSFIGFNYAAYLFWLGALYPFPANPPLSGLYLFQIAISLLVGFLFAIAAIAILVNTYREKNNTGKTLLPRVIPRLSYAGFAGISVVAALQMFGAKPEPRQPFPLALEKYIANSPAIHALAGQVEAVALTSQVGRGWEGNPSFLNYSLTAASTNYQVLASAIKRDEEWMILSLELKDASGRIHPIISSSTRLK